MASGCNRPGIGGDDPLAPRGSGSAKAAIAKCSSALRENLGKPFVELGLRDRAGNPHSTLDFNDKTTAFFVAGANCPGTRKWIPELAENDWRISGLKYDRLVFLAVSDRSLPVPAELAQYKVEWPMPGYLSSCTVYPAVYVVSENGVFAGFKLGRVSAPVVANEVKSE